GGKIRAKLVAEPRGADVIASDELELPFEGILDHRKLDMISECQFLWFDALQKLLVASMMFEQFHGASFLLHKILAMDGLRFITILVSSSNSAVV
ncbi:hypothetical protein NC653_031167, partial [Populus alba x Populus x berolinensis]